MLLKINWYSISFAFMFYRFVCVCVSAVSLAFFLLLLLLFVFISILFSQADFIRFRMDLTKTSFVLKTHKWIAFKDWTKVKINFVCTPCTHCIWCVFLYSFFRCLLSVLCILFDALAFGWSKKKLNTNSRKTRAIVGDENWMSKVSITSICFPDVVVSEFQFV